jgi:hypothetical protein
LGKSLEKNQVGCHFMDFSHRKNYSENIGNAWYPSKTKRDNYYNYKTNPEISKNK